MESERGEKRSTVYPQQSSLAPVWLFLNDIQPSSRSVAFYATLNNMCLYVFIIGLASLPVMYFTAV